MSYQWRKNGAVIVGATKAVLELTNIQAGDAGSYTLTVTGGGVSRVSAPIVVTVDGALAAPVIVAQPQSGIFEILTTASFSVKATGSAPLSYQWRKHGVIVPGATSGTLALEYVMPDKMGSYTVEVRNAKGAATSAPALLTVDANAGFYFGILAGNPSLRGFANGKGSAAVLNGPTGVAVDDVGNVYVADASNRMIRKVTSPGGDVTTLAGSAGLTGNTDGVGTAARFTNPIGLALDVTGTTLFVADRLGGRVRKIVVATGAVTTLAVGIPCNALAVDVQGNVYAVAEDHTVRKISPSGVISLVAGSVGLAGFADGEGTAARFNGPQGLTIDRAGNLYVADTYNHAIRKVTPEGAVTTVAGKPWNFSATDGPLETAGFVNPWGITLDQIGGIYVTEGNRYTVRKIIGTRVQTMGGVAYSPGTVVGWGAEARFAAPRGIAMDARNMLYVADSSANTVRGGVPRINTAAPLIATPPVDQTLVPGGTAVFSAAILGDVTSLYYTWWKNGVPMSGQNKPTLVLPQVQVADEGSYQLQVGNVYGLTISTGATLTVVKVPTITEPPVGVAVAAGEVASFSVGAASASLLSYQWWKGGVAIEGATSATLTMPIVNGADVGRYHVVVSNTVGSVETEPVALVVDTSAVSGAHALVAAGYVSGKTVTVRNTIAYGQTPAALEWHALLPTGWTLVASSATGATVAPAVGEREVLTWMWASVSGSPKTFTYTLRVPEGETGTQQIASLVKYRPAGATGDAPLVQRVAQPDPLSISLVRAHSADTDGDLRISLAELTRVIELYNVRHETVRTGAYAVAGGVTEDGFAPDPTRASGVGATLARHHSADTPGSGDGTGPDGLIALRELTRMIELYNTHTGTVHTGQYHEQAGTEDGFAPGP